MWSGSSESAAQSAMPTMESRDISRLTNNQYFMEAQLEALSKDMQSLAQRSATECGKLMTRVKELEEENRVLKEQVVHSCCKVNTNVHDLQVMVNLHSETFTALQKVLGRLDSCTAIAKHAMCGNLVDAVTPLATNEDLRIDEE